MSKPTTFAAFSIGRAVKFVSDLLSRATPAIGKTWPRNIHGYTSPAKQPHTKPSGGENRLTSPKINEKEEWVMKKLLTKIKQLFSVNRVYIGDVESVPTEWEGRSVLAYHHGWIITDWLTKYEWEFIPVHIFGRDVVVWSDYYRIVRWLHKKLINKLHCSHWQWRRDVV